MCACVPCACTSRACSSRPELLARLSTPSLACARAGLLAACWRGQALREVDALTMQGSAPDRYPYGCWSLKRCRSWSHRYPSVTGSTSSPTQTPSSKLSLCGPRHKARRPPAASLDPTTAGPRLILAGPYSRVSTASHLPHAPGQGSPHLHAEQQLPLRVLLLWRQGRCIRGPAGASCWHRVHGA